MASIRYLTDIHIDFGVIRLLADECRRVGMTRPLIVTDAGVRAAGLLAKAEAALGDMPHGVFDGTQSNPTEAGVRAAAAVLKQQGCDGLVAIGGGSSIDLAKGVAIAASHAGPLKHYATIEGGSPRITEAVLPLIAVPTTAGTGSEVARGSILIVDDGRKLGFHSWHLMPRVAILDPDLTLGLPPAWTRLRTAWKPSWRRPSTRRPTALPWMAWPVDGLTSSVPHGTARTKRRAGT